jgi:sphingolipid 4-desaturase/C4-monooxygenase
VLQVLSGLTIAAGFYFFGWRSMMYHFLCLSFETNAFVSVWRTGQDVAEHNANEDDRPTNSHYYWLYNFLFLNTGYHNEHHTFPQIAGPRLPALKKLAPEFFTSEIKTSYFALFKRQFVSHFESYRVSTAQEAAMGSVCMKKAQVLYAKETAEKAAKMAELSRTVKVA